MYCIEIGAKYQVSAAPTALNTILIAISLQGFSAYSLWRYC